jgi:hypothetical protein
MLLLAGIAFYVIILLAFTFAFRLLQRHRLQLLHGPRWKMLPIFAACMVGLFAFLGLVMAGTSLVDSAWRGAGTQHVKDPS